MKIVLNHTEMEEILYSHFRRRGLNVTSIEVESNKDCSFQNVGQPIEKKMECIIQNDIALNGTHKGKIPYIKMVREENGMGLREAKAVIDAVFYKLNIELV